jgi:hypothetical protein
LQKTADLYIGNALTQKLLQCGIFSQELTWGAGNKYLPTEVKFNREQTSDN